MLPGSTVGVFVSYLMTLRQLAISLRRGNTRGKTQMCGQMQPWPTLQPQFIVQSQPTHNCNWVILQTRGTGNNRYTVKVSFCSGHDGRAVCMQILLSVIWHHKICATDKAQRLRCATRSKIFLAPLTNALYVASLQPAHRPVSAHQMQGTLSL